MAELFNSLTGAAREPEYRKAVTAPDHMRDWFLDEVHKTIEAKERGVDARIVLKMNALVDARCIRALYEASQAGVTVDLNVRGICCLRPGLEGVSENITVVSVVGRFLEHSRIYGFHRGDERHYWLGSPDLMPRNLDTRVELLAPVESESLRRPARGHDRALPGRRHLRLGARPRRQLDPPLRRHARGASRADGTGARARRLFSGVAPPSAPAPWRRSRGFAPGTPRRGGPRPGGAGTRRSSSPIRSSGSGPLRP